MTSALAYTPRNLPLQKATVGAALCFLGAYVVAAFVFSSPLLLTALTVSASIVGYLAGVGRAVGVAIRIGGAMAVLLIVVNGLVAVRGATVLLRLGEWPLLGRVDVTAEALASGAVIGLRALAVTIALAVYSAAVDPDRVLRMLRPIASHSALTASLVSRLVPMAISDGARLAEARKLRGPGAMQIGRSQLARKLVEGALDRSVDIAATLELRGYALNRGSGLSRFHWVGRRLARYDARFLGAGAAMVMLAATVMFGGVGEFTAYPSLHMAAGVKEMVVCVAIIAVGLAPRATTPRVRRRPSIGRSVRSRGWRA